ncbi:hypothetical protein N431DRAFT_474092 [Stipitochalara longipes BDJ]|nr:hypothetical protein N431DRAFT_474092 [Stipitochalara longipes BDJ]
MTGFVHMPVVIPGISAYVSSELAAVKLFDYIASENPNIHVVNLQPGAIKTDLNRQAPVFDNPDLPGYFVVWLVSKVRVNFSKLKHT